jgi:hypothetical protein
MGDGSGNGETRSPGACAGAGQQDPDTRRLKMAMFAITLAAQEKD